MNPPSKSVFRCEPLEQLTHQLLFSPPDRRRLQVLRAECLHDEIDPIANYPLDYIAYRLTGYRSESGESVLLVGDAVLPDLRHMIDTLSRSIDLADDEPSETPAELAARLCVSKKTVDRWRSVGLRWRWMRPIDARPHIRITRSAIDRFAASNESSIIAAAKFTTVLESERWRLIHRARRVRQHRPDLSLNQVANHLARRTGRALETVRLILEKHDRDAPQCRLFPDRNGPLTSQQHRIITRARRRGVAVGRIASHFSCSRSTVYRAINQDRATVCRQACLNYIGAPIFDRPDADEVILRATLEQDVSVDIGEVCSVAMDDLPEPLRPIYCQSAIAESLEKSLFIRFNYLKYKASKIRHDLDRNDPHARDLDQIESCLTQTSEIRNRLIRANLPTALSVSRRHLVGKPGTDPAGLIELLEVANAILSEAVEMFNAARDQTFTSFLTNRLLQNFARLATPETPSIRARRRVVTDQIIHRIIQQLDRSSSSL